MNLNWTIEVVVDLLVGFSFLIGGLFSFKKDDRIKIKTVFFLKLVWFNLSAFFLMEGLSYLFLSTLLSQISAILIFPATFFLIVAINYNLKDTYNSISLILISCMGSILCYLAIQHGITKITALDGYLTIVWTGLFNIVSIFFIFVFCSYFFYWALKTWLNAPFEIKKEASIFLLGTFIAGIVSHIFYVITIWRYSFINLSNLSILIGLTICNIMIRKEPKILYVLPFIPYKFFIYDVGGNELLTYDWTKSKFNEDIISKFLLIVNQLNKNVVNEGNFLDIKLEESFLILYKLKFIIIGLFVSKASKTLRDLISEFAIEFEIQFEKELKEIIRNKSNFESAINLIEKYFSIFPSRIIRNKKQQLLFSKKYVKIPVELENKLKDIIKDENEYEFIKCEIQRSPEKISESFLTLLEELDELKKEHNNKDKEKLF